MESEIIYISNFPHAKKGIKLCYIGQMILLIGAAICLTSAGILALVVLNAEQGTEGIQQNAVAAVAFIVIFILLIFTSSVVEIIGLINAARDSRYFFVVLAFLAAASVFECLTFAFSRDTGWMYTSLPLLLNALSQIAEIGFFTAAVRKMVPGSKIAGKKSALVWVIIGLCILRLILSCAGIFIPKSAAAGNMISMADALVYDILFAVFLNKAEKEL